MAIDANLNAGMIGELTARKRREAIARVAKFYAERVAFPAPHCRFLETANRNGHEFGQPRALMFQHGPLLSASLAGAVHARVTAIAPAELPPDIRVRSLGILR